MATIKTAISIERPIFEQMDILAKDLEISRSHLFSLAAREYLQQHKNNKLLQSLNETYNDLPETEPIVAEMRPGHYKMVKDQW